MTNAEEPASEPATKPVEKPVPEVASEAGLKEQARSLLCEGFAPEDAADETGLSIYVVRGLMASKEVRAARKVLGLDKKSQREGRGRVPTKLKYAPVLPATSVPDALALLHNQLCLYGVGAQEADQVCDYMKDHNVDDLRVLVQVLSDIRMGENKKRMFLQTWATIRGISMTEQGAQDLGIIEKPYDWRRSLGYGGQAPSGAADGSPRPSEVGQILQGIGVLIRELNPKQTASAKIDPAIMAQLQRQDEMIGTLQKELEDAKEQSFKQDILDAVRQEIQPLKDGQAKLANEYTVLEKMIEVGGGRIGEFLIRSGMEPVNRPRQKVQSGSSIFDYLPPELVADQGGEG